MPWRGPVPGSPYLDDQFPSLGWALVEQLDEIFWWMPCTDEQVRKIVHCYRIDPNAKEFPRNWRAYRRAQFMESKGKGKSPLAAKLAIGELALDVVFDGWDANGEPVGRPRITNPVPWIQIAAVSIEQTDNTYGALLELLTDHDGQAADALGLDAGDTRTVRRANHRARIDKVTASAGAREGQRITHGIIDESHLYIPSSGGPVLAKTLRRNASKMGGWTLETTNSYDPALRSVAQATDEAVAKGAKGIYQYKPQVPHVVSIHNRRDVRRALKTLYADCPWVTVESILDEIFDPDTSEADARRFFLNEIWAGADAAWDEPTWSARRHPDGLVQPPPGTAIGLGFDGARYHDSTAIIGVTLDGFHEFVIGIWERPPEIDDGTWEVPGAEVDTVMHQAFTTWKVEKAYFDPPYWEDEVDRWAGEWSAVKRWYTARTEAMANAVRVVDQRLRAGTCTHDGHPVLTAHHLNAQKRTTQIRDDEGRFLWTIQKKAPKSPFKIDARVAGVLAHEAAGDAIAAGAMNTPPPVRAPRRIR
jgi:hypothetical protein